MLLKTYSVDSISKPQASSNGSGMYLEFLFRRAHSRSRVDRKYWSGESLYSRTTCSNSVTVGVIGPIGSGFPQLGFPRRLAMKSNPSSLNLEMNSIFRMNLTNLDSPNDPKDSWCYRNVPRARSPTAAFCEMKTIDSRLNYRFSQRFSAGILPALLLVNCGK